MKKIFLYAYDRQNLGDDLFVHTITKRYPKVKFYIWSDKTNQSVFRCLPNLKVLNKNSGFVRFLKKLRPSLVARYQTWLEKRCDAVVYIGGSIFPEYETWDVICNWWDYQVQLRPFFALGCNFGPYRYEGYRNRMSAVFSKMHDVCFRDSYSYNLFCENDTVRMAPDILFSYRVPQLEVNEKQVFVSVIDCGGRDPSSALDEFQEAYIQHMSELLQQYLSNGHTLVLCSFCENEGDMRGIHRILNRMGRTADSEIQILPYTGTNDKDVIGAIAASECVIATRFHAMVLGLKAGKPVLPIIYSDKTLRVLEDLGFRGNLVDCRKEASWANITDSSGWIHPEQLSLEQLESDAQAHFLKLDQLLK